MAKVGWRYTYVERQLATARWAIDRGSIGAARAALRVLSSEDFDASQEASYHLRTLRNHAVENEDVLDAMRRLCSLAPCAPIATRGHPEEAPSGGPPCR